MRNGFVALYLTMIILAVVFGIATAVTLLTSGHERLTSSRIHSAQAFWLAEAGIEDAVYRIKKGLSYPTSYTVPLGTSQVEVAVLTAGTTRTVTARGTERANTRILAVDIAPAADEVQFFYGVQVGAGGLTLGDNSTVVGNVFSNGPIQGNGVTKSTITGSAEVAGTNLVKDIRINGNATAHRFDNCSIGGTASYVTTFTNCTASSTVVIASAPTAQNFPISQVQIDAWKAEAAAGGTLAGLNVGNNESVTLGPKKINGAMTLGNSVTLTLTGTVWVTGTVDFGNSNVIQLDPRYGPSGGVFLADGVIDIGNPATFAGSGMPESRFLLLSTFGPGDAIDVGNSATSTIFYAPNGIIDVGNNLTLAEATGYGLKVGNGAAITYETGLARARFSTGPGGGFSVSRWREIE